MNCKYCHLKTHYIDKCPTIICKTCKDIGHPQWLCNNKKTLKNNSNSNNSNNSNNLSMDKKYCFTDEIKKSKPVEKVIQKNVNYYLKMENMQWGEMAFF